MEYLTKVSISAALLLPLQTMAMLNYRNIIGYSKYPIPSQVISAVSTGSGSMLQEHAMNLGKMKACLPFLAGTLVYANAVYAFNTSNALLNLLYVPLVMTAYGLNFIGAQTLALKNIHSQYSMPKGFLFFMAINIFMPIQIESLQGKDKFKNLYYDYLDSEAEGLQDLGFSYY